MQDDLFQSLMSESFQTSNHIAGGKLTGQKPALKMKEVWAIRTRLELEGNTRSLAMFNLAIDSKLRGCDLVRIRVSDIFAGGEVKTRGVIIQKKTSRPVHFEISRNTRKTVKALIDEKGLNSEDYLFKSRVRSSPHLSTRQYSRLVQHWVASIGLNPATYGTHSLRRTKAALIYRKTGNLRAVQLLLGHSKLESTVRYLGVEVDDALEISSSIDL
ncbi:MAG: tyrosine-type recombinase/integrase [Hyphomonadaceae bacterium]|nr:tyrosine-type recombinase/integrase [Hyphomonadaceae bacterium]